MATQSERALPALELKKVSLYAELRNNVSQSAEIDANQAEMLAAQLFDAALTDAKIGTELAAQIIGVNKSLVSRWRSGHYREQPSYAQMLRLPASFQEARRKAEGQALGSNRRALLRLIEAVGDLAEAV